MHNEEIRDSFRQYAERVSIIRRLSSPRINREDTAENYSARLQENFRKIGDLASINRRMLDTELYPLLNSTEDLDSRLVEELNELADVLLSVADEGDDCEKLDLPVSSMIADRLLMDADQKCDITNRIRRMDSEAVTCYSMIHMTGRISADPSLCRGYIDKGMALGEEFLCMLDKDFILQIPDAEMRARVLTNARFTTSYFERVCGDEDINRYSLDIMDRMLEIADDEFYHEAVPEFDWKGFRYRCLEYFVSCTEINNSRGFSPELLEHIEERAEELENLLASDPAYFAQIAGPALCPVHIARCRYLSGRMELEEYRDILLDAYEHRDREDFGMDGAYFNAMVPLELLCLMEPTRLRTPEVMLLKRLYSGLSSYLFHCPDSGTISHILDYYIRVIDHFIDVPSGIEFEDFMLRSLAGVHPPTYVHSCMVGQITECLSFHLMRTEPERFIGYPGCGSVKEVLEKREEIIRYAYHAGLCHDFGKIYAIDTIFVYGRGLLDLEFSIIRSHPDMGAALLAAHEGTKRYAEIARLHHTWYDGRGGYPEDAGQADRACRTVVDLLRCADGMDAATDPVGRSYHKGKTLKDFMEELREGAGTRYAPWLPGLLEQDGVFEDLDYLLTHGREYNYRDTFAMLKDVQG